MKIRDLKYLLAFLIPFLALIALQLQNSWSFSTVIFTLILFLEIIIKPVPHYMDTEIEQHSERNVLYNSLVISVQMVGIIPPPVWFVVMNPKVKAIYN